MIRRLNIIPIVISGLFTYGVYLLSSKFCIRPDFEKFLELFITAFSILIGFLFTIATILNSFNNDKLSFIRKSGGMKSMYRSLRKSIYSAFLAIFLSIIYFLLNSYIEDYEIIIYFIIWTNVLAMVFCLNFTKLFLDIIASD